MKKKNQTLSLKSKCYNEIINPNNIDFLSNKDTGWTHNTW